MKTMTKKLKAKKKDSRLKWILLVIPLLFLLTSCGTFYSEKQSATLSAGVYAIKDSLTAGRVDLTEFYSEQISRIIIPPKTKIKINPLQTKDGKKFILIPSSIKGEPLLIDSKDYKKLLNENNDLRKLIEADQKFKKDYANKIDKELQQKEKQSLEKDKLINKLQQEVANNKAYKFVVKMVLWIALLGIIAYIVGKILNKWSLLGWFK